MARYIEDSGHFALSREDRERIAKALMAYKDELKRDADALSDLAEYNQVEIVEVDHLARGLELGPDYYRWER